MLGLDLFLSSGDCFGLVVPVRVRFWARVFRGQLTPVQRFPWRAELRAPVRVQDRLRVWVQGIADYVFQA